jgi:hypothetical protein
MVESGGSDPDTEGDSDNRFHWTVSDILETVSRPKLSYPYQCAHQGADMGPRAGIDPSVMVAELTGATHITRQSPMISRACIYVRQGQKKILHDDQNRLRYSALATEARTGRTQGGASPAPRSLTSEFPP